MGLKDRLLENSLVYKLWQKPFVDQKLAPLYRSGAIDRAKRVLDVGCGPGTNTPHFEKVGYLGIDINPKYTEFARARFGRDFVVADVTEYQVSNEGTFDFILVNSLLHHIDTAGARKLLRHLSTLLSPDGHVHVLDMVLPPTKYSIPRILARLDRGEHARSLEDLRALVEDAFDVVDFQRYPLQAGGLALWDFVYFKGRSASSVDSHMP